MDLILISKRTYTDRSGIQMIKNLRLTDLGIDFWKYVESYDDIKPDKL